MLNVNIPFLTVPSGTRNKIERPMAYNLKIETRTDKMRINKTE